MKKLCIGVLCLFWITMLSAQQETLFGKARVWGVWGGPLVEISSFNENLNNSYGGGGGLVIDRFFLGAYGLGSTDLEDLINDDNYNLDLAHGGLWLGYTHQPYKMIHPYASVRVGWGGLDFDLEDFDSSYDDWDAVMVVTPELGVELNVTSFFHIAATAGYRWVDGVSSTHPTVGQNDLNGFNVGLNFRFGWFGNWSRYRNCD